MNSQMDCRGQRSIPLLQGGGLRDAIPPESQERTDVQGFSKLVTVNPGE